MKQVKNTCALALALLSLTACVGAGSQPESPAAAAPSAASAAVGDVSGTWTGAIKETEADRGHPITLLLKMNGATVTGSLTGGPPRGAEQPLVNGKLQGDQLSFNVKDQGPQGEPLTIPYKGRVADGRIRGTVPSPMGTATWEVTKQ